MAFTPSSDAFVYRQYFSTSPHYYEWSWAGEDITNIRNLEILGLPNWLIAYNLIIDEPNEKITFNLRVDENIAFNLAEGTYEADLRLRFRAKVGPVTGIVTSDPLPILLTVQHTTALSLSPTVFSFSYLIGGSLPQNQAMQITTENNWQITVSQSWITLSLTSGYQNAQVFIGIDPTGLAPGQYEGIIQVADGLFTEQATISLLVSEGDTETTFLTITPREIQFISELGVENTQEKTIKMGASHSWTASASQPWIQLSASSGAAGVQSVTVSVDSHIHIAETGTFLGIITFESQGIQKLVYVQLIVLEFLLEGIESDGFYFADDRNRLVVSNVFANMFLRLEAVASNGSLNIPYQQEAPYIDGFARALMGMEANHLISSPAAPSNLVSRIRNGLSPLTIDFTAFNVNKTTSQTTLIQAFNNVRFLRGKTPVIENKLCYIPPLVHIPPSGAISLSVLSFGDPGNIVLTGDVAANISTAIQPDLYVYNAIVNLQPFGLSEGAKFTVAWADVSVDVVVCEEGTESHLLAFQNEWQEYEFFNCRGFIEKISGADKKTTELQLDGDKITKTIEIDPEEDYALSTGYIYTHDEAKWLSRILEAKLIYLYLDGAPVEIQLSSKNIEVYKTRDNLRSYKLKFSKATK